MGTLSIYQLREHQPGSPNQVCILSQNVVLSIIGAYHDHVTVRLLPCYHENVVLGLALTMRQETAIAAAPIVAACCLKVSSDSNSNGNYTIEEQFSIQYTMKILFSE